MVFGLLVAILVFWAVGAYNRLVRLRSDAMKAFSALDNVVAVQPALIKTGQLVAGAGPNDGVEGYGGMEQAVWSRLEAAAGQFAQALANARARPLDAEHLRAFSTAYDVLVCAWRAPEAECLDAVLNPRDLRTRLAGLDEQATILATQFDTSVTAYNLAIRQFPALLLAGIWHFRTAETLAWNRTVA